MFTELMPLLKQRALIMIVSDVAMDCSELT
jgi:hypothetical protein